MLIEQNPDIDYPVIAAALADEITRLTDIFLLNPQHYMLRESYQAGVTDKGSGRIGVFCKAMDPVAGQRIH
eukprot:1496587-Prorocentrum_lima.AAC.1